MSVSDTDIQWFIARDGKQHGPVSDLELKKIIELKHLKPTDLVWRQGFTDWRSASSVFPELSAPAPAPSPEPPKPQPTAQTASSASAPSSPEPSAARPAASTGPANAATSNPAPSTAAKPATSQVTANADPAKRPLASNPATSSAAPQKTQGPSFGSQSFGAPSREDNWRAQNEPSLRAEPTTQSRTLGGPAQRSVIGPQPGNAAGHPDLGAARPTQRVTTDSRRPSELAPQPRMEAVEPPPSSGRGRRMALVATILLALAGFGAWLMSQHTDDVFTYLQSDDGSSATQTAAPTAVDAKKSETAAIPAAATAAPAPSSSGPLSSDDWDRNLQRRTMWVAIKQSFPEWYQARVSDLARLSSEQKPQTEVDHYVANALVALRRENARYALAASSARHKDLAGAFLANLNRLSQESGDSCYDFISKGELSNTIIERIGDPAKSTDIDAQISATLAAISEGRSHPTEHTAPLKTDYDVLAGELGRLGWTQADMQLFANPKELAQAPRSRVCSMLKDWFTAHLAIQDPAAQGRLLFETLKPVISG